MTETQKNISNQTEELSSDEVKNQEISPVKVSIMLPFNPWEWLTSLNTYKIPTRTSR